jgi:hypothetical protein
MSEASAIKGSPVSSAEINEVPNGTQTSLGDMLGLPPPEHIDEVPSPDSFTEPITVIELPTGEINHKLITELFDRTTGLKDEDRISRLLTQAYNAVHPAVRAVPSWLIAYMADTPVDWYHQHKDFVASLIEDSDKTPLASVYDDTDALVTESLFLRNAQEISESAWLHGRGDLGMRVELSARLMVLEAVQGARRAS